MEEDLLIKVCIVGGNALSAFLSWRLQATQMCDVTLVWKNQYETVQQYGVSFKSPVFGNERFKPYAVVSSTAEAAARGSQFDYVLLCVKALPDHYDISEVIAPVVSVQHTCILVNTTHALGIETYLEQRFPMNVVLSLVSAAEIVQLGPSEFEHKSATDLWVGAANRNPKIPAAIQTDMAAAIAMTLTSGKVNCKTSPNIRQQQFETMMGPVAFHPASVIFENTNYGELMEQPGVRAIIEGVLDELIAVAEAKGCQFPAGYRHEIIQTMTQKNIEANQNSIMYLDFKDGRPMEVETYLGAPIRLAQEVDVKVPRVETLYGVMYDLNIKNQARHKEGPPAGPAATATPGSPGSIHPPRISSHGAQHMNGGPPSAMMSAMRGGRGRPPMSGPPGMRRGGPMNGYGPGPRMSNGNYGPGPQLSRRPSFEDSNLDEFSHVVMYDNLPEGGLPDGEANGHHPNDMVLRERELALRQRELALREAEMNMRRHRPGPRRPPPPASINGAIYDDEEDDDFIDGPTRPMMNPNQDLDMVSITSNRNRKSASQGNMRGMDPRQRGGSRMGFRPPFGKNRTSATIMDQMPNPRDAILDSSLLGISSNRYGDTDRSVRMQHHQSSRANSMTTPSLYHYPDHMPRPPMHPNSSMRRSSQSPGNPLAPPSFGPRPGGRPSPPHGYTGGPPHGGMPGAPRGGRPSPPNMQQPVPRHPPGHGNAVAPDQVEQQAGVSTTLYPPKHGPQVRSLTGSASGSGESGDSGDASVNSSSSSLAHHQGGKHLPRPPPVPMK
ncbi:hypothetical protein P152DRAFT_497369 [Eremomyces bilateralis CBS 781.70]|uniref:ApbA-domain-containing protein n=1 Tax=Eremomyces bilateralis CBS 781.70 TaxID=1392243 RepID=A0A6G1FS36_9PEZI|nr:uncharacterized protein P152DRAFT_497369 [Eremomyces bilateralis CBS 781.70]KAF1808587.1 hypothetical protein P152DRAFT_497369 [Eremomyces bilateralis CBS 781.70]